MKKIFALAFVAQLLRPPVAGGRSSRRRHHP